MFVNKHTSTSKSMNDVSSCVIFCQGLSPFIPALPFKANPLIVLPNISTVGTYLRLIHCSFIIQSFSRCRNSKIGSRDVTLGRN